jgi:LysR family transcriptional regulator, transcription activator of glutamate synthase operon
VKVETLRWFVSVADGRTVTDTAARFHATQPAVTRGLRRLEAATGAALFEPAGRRLRLTPAGELLRSAAQRAIAELDGARDAIAARRDPEAGTVRLGFLAPLGVDVVPELLHAFRAAHPKVDFELRQDGAERIHRALVDGALDVLLTAPRAASPGVRWDSLFTDEIVVAVGRSHPWHDRETVDVRELAGEPLVLMAPGYRIREIADELLAGAGITPRVAFEGHDLLTLYGLIGADCGVGVYPRSGARADRVRELPLTPRTDRPVGLAWCPERQSHAVVGTFRRFARRHMRGPGA